MKGDMKKKTSRRLIAILREDFSLVSPHAHNHPRNRMPDVENVVARSEAFVSGLFDASVKVVGV
jgi:hypothetical protein